MPDNIFDQFACSTCGGDTSVINSGNAAYSDNNGTVNDLTNNNVFQSNDANIENNLYLESQTGDNTANQNNQGDVNIQTGQSTVDASVVNIANMNILGGNMWLVIINEAGNWIGKLFGAGDNANLAGSDGVEFAIDPNGEISVINANNAAYSDNNGSVNNTTNNNLTQVNTANVVNNLNLTANTGGNDASKNNGPVNLQTGDAKAIANLVNFVNNNIAGGKLLVTFVNVFGSWAGDFMTPGSHKDQEQVAAANNSGSQNSSNSQNNNSSNGNTVAVAGAFAQNSNTNTDSSTKKQSTTHIFFGGKVNVQTAGNAAGNVLTKVLGNTDEKTNGVKLNLAWILLLIPLAAGFIIFKKIRKIHLRNISAVKI